MTDAEIEKEFEQIVAGLTVPEFQSRLQKFALFVRWMEGSAGVSGFTCPSCHGNMAQWPCPDCGSTGRIVNIAATQAYADKVLEVAVRLNCAYANAEANGTTNQDAAIAYTNRAEALIQAAHEAASQKASKEKLT